MTKCFSLDLLRFEVTLRNLRGLLIGIATTVTQAYLDSKISKMLQFYLKASTCCALTLMENHSNLCDLLFSSLLTLVHSFFLSYLFSLFLLIYFCILYYLQIIIIFINSLSESHFATTSLWSDIGSTNNYIPIWSRSLCLGD